MESYSVAELKESCKLILQWLKALKLIDGSVASIDSSKIYTEGKVQEGTAEVYDYLKKENKRGYKIFAIYDPICGILIDFRLFPINKADNPNLIPLVQSAGDILGKSTLKKVYFDRGFYDGEHFEWLNKNHIQFVCRGNFNEDGFKLEFNVKKTKEAYYGHIEGINSFVAKMREKRNILDAICLSH